MVNTTGTVSHFSDQTVLETLREELPSGEFLRQQHTFKGFFSVCIRAGNKKEQHRTTDNKMEDAVVGAVCLCVMGLMIITEVGKKMQM